MTTAIERQPRERLRRLLLLVPFLARHQGLSVDALARAFGLEREVLLSDLAILPLVGRPPFTPGDYLDLTIEGDEVSLTLDQRFSRPPNLTVAEAAALVAAASVLDPRPGDALWVALDKLEALMPRHTRMTFRGLSQRFSAGGHSGVQGFLSALTAAAEGRRVVVMEYLTPWVEASMRRVVQPWRIFYQGNHWYLLGWDVAKKAQRCFRVDRITRFTSTDERFERPSHVPPVGEEFEQPRRPSRVAEVPTLRFSKRLGPWALDRFGDEAKRLATGQVRVRLPGATEDWLVALVLQCAGDVRVVGPPWLRAAVQRAVNASLKAYG